MIGPVRVRLAMWHTASLAVLLVAFAVGTYLYFARSSIMLVDQELGEALRAFQGETRAEPGEDSDLENHLEEAASEFQSSSRIFAFDRHGRLIAATRPDPHHPGPETDLVSATATRNAGSKTVALTLPGRPAGHRMMILPVGGPDDMLIAGVHSLRERHETLRSMLLTFLVAIPLALILAGLAGYRLAQRSLAPVIRMTEEQRRFMADAAHELRTPVAIMRAEADVALARAYRTEDEYRDSLQLLREESVRLSSIIEDLFMLARADAGQVPLRVSNIDLEELATECVRAVQSLAAARSITVKCAAQGNSPYHGDVELLRRLFLNLLDNAIKYSPEGGGVWLRVETAGEEYRITVEDNGPPIDPVVRAHIFERFYRSVDEAAAATAGAGLGLSIASWIAHAHGGQLALAEQSSGGNRFVLMLPRKAI